MRHWIIITADNERIPWIETFRNRFLRRFPEVQKDGFVWLDKFPYVPNPARVIREYYHDTRLSYWAFLGGLILSGILYIPYGIGGALTGFFIGIFIALIVGGPRREDDFQYWRQNEPDAIDFNDIGLTPGSIGVTSDTIRQFAKSEHLRRLVEPETNWALIAVLLLLVGIAAGAIGYSVGR